MIVLDFIKHYDKLLILGYYGFMGTFWLILWVRLVRRQNSWGQRHGVCPIDQRSASKHRYMLGSVKQTNLAQAPLGMDLSIRWFLPGFKPPSLWYQHVVIISGSTFWRYKISRRGGLWHGDECLRAMGSMAVCLGSLGGLPFMAGEMQKCHESFTIPLVGGLVASWPACARESFTAYIPVSLASQQLFFFALSIQ